MEQCGEGVGDGVVLGKASEEGSHRQSLRRPTNQRIEMMLSMIEFCKLRRSDQILRVTVDYSVKDQSR